MKKYIILILIGFLSPVVQSMPRIPSYNVTRAGATTTYKILESGGKYVPTSKASTGLSLEPLDANYAAQNSKYVSDLGIGSGEEIAAIRVSRGISAANLAAAVMIVIPKLMPLGIVLTVGMAIYDYLSNNGLSLSNDGTLTEGLTNFSSSGNGANPGLPYCAGGYTNKTGGGYYQFYKVTGEPTCASGDSYMGGCGPGNNYTCRHTTQIIPNGTPISNANAQTKLTANPPSNPAPLVKELHDFDLSGLSDPIADSPIIEDVLTPSLTSPQRQIVTPTGEVQTATDTTHYTKIADDTLTGTTNTTTVTVHNDSTTTTSTTNNAPPLPSTETQTDCDKYPNSIGCSQFGTVPTPEIIPTIVLPIAMPWTSWGGGSCPAPVTSVHGLVVMDYQPLCDKLVIFKPILITCALLASLFIIAGAVKD